MSQPIAPACMIRLPFSLQAATPAARVHQDQKCERVVVGRLSLAAQGAQASGPLSEHAEHNSSYWAASQRATAICHMPH